MIPSKPVPPSDSAPRAGGSAASGERPRPEGGHELLDRYAQQELAQIRAGRQALEEEKKAAEQALDQRRQELERQSQLLVQRLQELHEREQRVASELEDALPERSGGRPTMVGGSDASAGGDSTILETEGLKRKLRELEMSLELLSAERDAAWAQLQQLRDQRQEVEELRAERDALKNQLPHDTAADIADVSAQAGELEEVRRQLQEMQQLQDALRQERDEAWSYLQELPEHVKQVDRYKAERDAALEQLRKLTHDVAQPNPESEWVDLESVQGEKTLLKIQIRDHLDAIDQLRSERDQAWAYINDMARPGAADPEEVAKLRAERDAALAKLQQAAELSPEHWDQEESEFAGLRLQLKQEQRQLAEDAKELRRREQEMHKRAQQTQLDAQREQQRLDSLASELAELGRQLREDRGQIEVREREMRLRDAQTHLREAEIREMVEIAELDAARERSELNQERLKLARLRAAIQFERETLKADQEKLMRRGSGGSSAGSKY